jgi:hypothetical protein
MGQYFEPTGKRSDPFKIRLAVRCGDQGFFESLGVKGVIVD